MPTLSLSRDLRGQLEWHKDSDWFKIEVSSSDPLYREYRLDINPDNSPGDGRLIGGKIVGIHTGIKNGAVVTAR